MNTKINDRPEYGVQYALTGGKGQACIANGNSWSESKVHQPITMKEWEDVGSFEEVICARKKDGQVFPMEISEDVYMRFMECLPPTEQGTDRLFDGLKLPIQSYFLVGEPYNFVNNQLVYATFVKASNKFWFIGYTHKASKPCNYTYKCDCSTCINNPF